MKLLVFFGLVVLAFAAPPSTETPAAGLQPDPEDTALTIETVPYSVQSWNYKLPNKYKEVPYTNDWLFSPKYPEYSLNFNYHCPLKIVRGDHIGLGILYNTKACLTTVIVKYWCERAQKEVVLDTYSVTSTSVFDYNTMGSILVQKAPDDTTHYIALAMTDRTCKQMQYTVDESMEIKTTVQALDCKEVEQLVEEFTHLVIEYRDEVIALTNYTEEEEISETSKDTIDGGQQ